MLILGIDPGTATTGFGVVNSTKSGVEVVTWGLIETDKALLKEKRLDLIFEQLVVLINKFKPDVFVFEKVFFSNNAKTVISIGQAQGVILLAASKTNVHVEEYAPGTIKKLITGNGRANKKEVQEHIRLILGNRVKSAKHKKTHFDNEADALAIALTHAFTVTDHKIKIPGRIILKPEKGGLPLRSPRVQINPPSRKASEGRRGVTKSI